MPGSHLIVRSRSLTVFSFKSLFARCEVNEEAPACWTPRPPLVECHKLRLAALGHSQVVTLKHHRLELHGGQDVVSSTSNSSVSRPMSRLSFSSAGAEGAEDLGFKFLSGKLNH